MKLLVACELPEFALDELRSLGLELVHEPGVIPEDLPRVMGRASILLVDSRRVTAEAIAAGPDLQLIVRRGSDTGNIAVDEASAEGIFIANCRATDADAIAEFILLQLLSLDRDLDVEAVGQPLESTDHLPRGLAGRRLGIIHFDAAATALARRAKACHLSVSACADDLTPERAERMGLDYCAWPRDLARECSMVAVHVPPEAPEQLYLDPELLDNLSAGSTLVYVGPHGGYDRDALRYAVQNQGLKLAIDIRAPHSQRIRDSLAELPGVRFSVNRAQRTRQAHDATAREVIRVVREFLVRGEVLNCVNLIERSPAKWQLVLRLRDTVGVMAAIMDTIRQDGVNAEEISTRVFTGARAVWCSIALDERPSAAALEAVSHTPGVLHMEVRAMI